MLLVTDKFSPHSGNRMEPTCSVPASRTGNRAPSALPWLQAGSCCTKQATPLLQSPTHRTKALQPCWGLHGSAGGAGHLQWSCCVNRDSRTLPERSDCGSRWQERLLADGAGKAAAPDEICRYPREVQGVTSS